MTIVRENTSLSGKPLNKLAIAPHRFGERAWRVEIVQYGSFSIDRKGFHRLRAESVLIVLYLGCIFHRNPRRVSIFSVVSTDLSVDWYTNRFDVDETA